MSNFLEKLFGIASPGKQLTSLGTGLEDAAKGMGATADQLSNNKGNRILILILAIGLILAVVGWYKSSTKSEVISTVQQDKVDAGKDAQLKIYQALYEESKESIKDLRAEAKAAQRYCDSVLSESATTIKRLNSIIDIEQSKRK